MDIPNILNEPSALHNDTTTRGVSILDLVPVVSTVEDRGKPGSSIPASFSEQSPTRAVFEVEPASCNKRSWDSDLFDSYLAPLARPGSVPHTQQSPNHRSSDSRSSFSSCAPPSTPQSHSRISSTSTTWEMYTMGAPPDSSSFEPRPGCPDSMERYPQQLGRDEPISPVMTADSSPLQGSNQRGFPSGATLVKPLDKLRTHDTLSNTEKVSNFGSLALLDPNSISAHKRTHSEPNPHGSKSFNPSIYPPHSDSRPATPISQPNQQEPDRIIETPNTTSSTATGSPALQYGHPRCMYTENCDTGSALRKAISHIFGRNKICTRMIPQCIWVHYCRKHYQRSRYRNSQEYAKLQCELVLIQIQRVQQWSDDNKSKGETTVVQDWTLSMRKREQNRVRDKSKKRLHSDRSDDEEDDHNLDHAVLTGTAVPAWLRKQCGNGYSTDEITGIVRRIQEEVNSGKLNQIPDIEILPNIPTDGVEDTKSKTPCKRKPPSSSIHKRSRSLSVTRHPDPDSSQRLGQAFYMPYLDATGLPSTDKRQRIMNFRPHHEHSGFAPSRAVSIMAPALGPTIKLPFHPVFRHIPQIQESRAEDPSYGSEAVRDSHSTYYRGPLPPPSPPSLPNTHMTIQLEPSPPGPSRFGHIRSVSEYYVPQSNMRLSFQMDRPGPPAPFATTYPEPNYVHSGPSPTNNYHPMTNQSHHQPHQSEYLESNWQRQQTAEGSRHARHQSTPNAIHSTLSQPQTHPYRQGHGSRYTYEEPCEVSRIHLQYPLEQPRSYPPPRPEIQGFEQTSSPSGERH